MPSGRGARGGEVLSSHADASGAGEGIITHQQTQHDLPSNNLTDVYDPMQDRETIQAAKVTMRQITERANDMKGDPRMMSHGAFTHQLQALDRNLIQVKTPGLATLDAHALKVLSEAVPQKVRQLKLDEECFSTDDFLSHFTTILGKRASWANDSDSEEEEVGGLVDWTKAGKRFMKYSRRAPRMDVMQVYGPLDIQQKKRKLTQRVVIKKDPSQIKKPETVCDVHESILKIKLYLIPNLVQLEGEQVNVSNEFEKLIESLGTILKEWPEKDLNLFKFFINPNSYSQSVENAFFLSFLINDGLAGIEFEDEAGNPNDYPRVFAVVRGPQQDLQEDGIRNRQFIMDLTIQNWKEAIEVYEIQDSMIPDRPKTVNETEPS